MGAVTIQNSKPSTRWSSALLDGGKPDQYSALVPAAAAEAVIAEVRADLARMPTDDEVVVMLRRLLGAYRTGQVQDPETYADLLREELASAPLLVGARAVTDITRRLKWPPTRAELVEAIADQRAKMQGLAYRARLHIEENARREAEGARATEVRKFQSDPTARATVADMVAKVTAPRATE